MMYCAVGLYSQSLLAVYQSFSTAIYFNYHFVMRAVHTDSLYYGTYDFFFF